MFVNQNQLKSFFENTDMQDEYSSISDVSNCCDRHDDYLGQELLNVGGMSGWGNIINFEANAGDENHEANIDQSIGFIQDEN